jgi:hypothetical protein
MALAWPATRDKLIAALQVDHTKLVAENDGLRANETTYIRVTNELHNKIDKLSIEVRLLRDERAEILAQLRAMNVMLAGHSGGRVTQQQIVNAPAPSGDIDTMAR